MLKKMISISNEDVSTDIDDIGSGSPRAKRRCTRKEADAAGIEVVREFVQGCLALRNPIAVCAFQRLDLEEIAVPEDLYQDLTEGDLQRILIALTREQTEAKEVHWPDNDPRLEFITSGRFFNKIREEGQEGQCKILSVIS